MARNEITLNVSGSLGAGLATPPVVETSISHGEIHDKSIIKSGDSVVGEQSSTSVNGRAIFHRGNAIKHSPSRRSNVVPL